MRREGEIELWQAADVLEMSEEALGKLAEERKLTVRRSENCVFFLRSEIEEIELCQLNETLSARDSEESSADACSE